MLTGEKRQIVARLTVSFPQVLPFSIGLLQPVESYWCPPVKLYFTVNCRSQPRTQQCNTLRSDYKCGNATNELNNLSYNSTANTTDILNLLNSLELYGMPSTGVRRPPDEMYYNFTSRAAYSDY
ncbi:hypothetical protein RUM43_008752 [Polyplax serrata]|uniref:Uncharacterized protein n=1 Tax=Polyplax serrata TaxID=468196 RepID=A0AAN8NNY4_POLSC